MAAEVSSVQKRKPPGILKLLSAAFSEWVIIFLLFVDATILYLVTKFAEHCELKIPCPLCSRIDLSHGEKKSRCYWNLLCGKHREDVSSLVPCSIHGKLADGNEMCEECFLPVAMRNKSNSESYRLLVGKLWVDIERLVLHDMMLTKHIKYGSPGRRICSCCNKAWRVKSNAERLLGLTSPAGLGASKANIKPPLPRVPGRSRFSRRDSLKRLRDKLTGQVTHLSAVTNNVDTLSHVGYRKLKLSSDSESEVIFSEDDDDNLGSCSKNESEAECDIKSGRYSQSQTHVTTFRSEKQMIQDYKVKPALLDLPNLLDLSENEEVNPALNTFMEDGLRELNCPEYYHKPCPRVAAEPTSLAEIPLPQNAGEGSSGVPLEESTLVSSLPHYSALATLTELSEYNVNPLSNIMTPLMKQTNDGGSKEIGHTLTDQYAVAVVGTSPDNAHLLESNNMTVAEASTQSSENRKLSKTHADDLISDSVSPKNESMNCLHQVCTSGEGLVSKVKPRVPDKQDQFKIHEDAIYQAIPVTVSLERNDSDHHESLDGISDGDIVGEGTVDRLKRQIEHDHSCISSLYKELEEERNAAGVAANQAMAMITRLQEEKATLHMEALQYLRMMEEQSEYDMEALERANDLLAEKEKELHDLETELELCRSNIVDAAVVGHSEIGCAPVGSKSSDTAETSGILVSMNNTLPNFEDEKLYILHCLNKLEKKFHQSDSNRKLDEMSNGLDSDSSRHNEADYLETIPLHRKTILLNEVIGQKNLSFQKWMSASNGTPATNDLPDQDRGNVLISEQRESLSGNFHEITCAFEKEITDLHLRLEALETDNDFLRHVSNAHQNGNDGLCLLQEIANQLQELRKIEFSKR